MKIKRTENKSFEIEQQLMVWCITDDIFLRKIKNILKLEYIQSGTNVKILTWIIDFFGRTQQAPKKLIWDIFDIKKEDMDEDVVEKIEATLNNLDAISDSVTNNRDYYFEKIHTHFRQRSMLLFTKKIQEMIPKDPELAESMFAGYKRVEKDYGKGIDVFKDRQAILDAFSDENNQLTTFRFPGVFGEAVGDFYRGDVSGFLAPQKRGKTWMMLYAAYVAATFNLKVLFWSKEMLKNIVVKRFFQMLLGDVTKDKGELLIPYFNGNRIEYRKKNKAGIDVKNVLKMQSRMEKSLKSGSFRVIDMQDTNGNTFEKLSAVLDNLETYDSFVPDVIIDDYLTITGDSPETPREFRHKIDWKWGKAKVIATERNCFYLSGSQSAKKTHSQDIEDEDVSEDIRVFSTVGQMIKLNQTQAEKKLGIMRISVSGRHEEYTTNDEALLLQCLSIGRPSMGSRWLSDIENYDKNSGKIM